jgi:hypothetical protein
VSDVEEEALGGLPFWMMGGSGGEMPIIEPIDEMICVSTAGELDSV